MAAYIILLQWTDQGVRNFKDTTRRATAAQEAAAKVGAKLDMYWTLGGYDLVILGEAPDDETMTAAMLKLSALGNVKTQTLRAFKANEMEAILKKAG